MSNPRKVPFFDGGSLEPSGQTNELPHETTQHNTTDRLLTIHDNGLHYYLPSGESPVPQDILSGDSVVERSELMIEVILYSGMQYS